MNFFLNTYKTSKCKNFCKKPECLFYHDASDYRRKVTTYSPYMCLDAIKEGFCIHKNCEFCSNYTEYLYHPQNYKKRKCIYVSMSITCKLLTICPNYHSEDDKYIPANDPPLNFLRCKDSNRRPRRSKLDLKDEKAIDFKVAPEDPEIKVQEQRVDNADIKYVYGDEINKFEDRKNEFKECKGKNFDISYACSLISNYVSAFLNTEGGTIFYGIADNGRITGVHLSRRNRDLFTQCFDNVLNRFNPRVNPNFYRMTYVPLFTIDRRIMQDTYIIEIEVQQGALNEIYFTHKEEAFVKRDSCITQLKGLALVGFTKNRSGLIN